jgi:hypothetical protein
MGYWDATTEEEHPLIWGDTPADIMGIALDGITAAFLVDVGREPTDAEILAGVRFD